MKARLYRAVQMMSTRAVQDIAKIQFWVAKLGAKSLDKIDGDRLKYEVALIEQQEGLTELKLLSQTIQIKEVAVADGGFDEEHGPLLAMAANALQDACGWDEDSVMDWFSALVLDEDGENLGADIEVDEE